MMMTSSDIEYLLKLKEKIINNCKICRGTDLNCKCYAKFNIEKEKIIARIPVQYRDTPLSKLTSQKIQAAKNQIQEYIANLNENIKKGIGLFFYGPNGSAKTYLACHVLTTAIEHGYSVLFFPFFEMVDSFINDKENMLHIIDKVDILLLDDIGFIYRAMKEEINYADTLLDRTIKSRAYMNLPIFVTSDKSPTELLSNKVGSRLISELKNRTLLVKCDGRGNSLWNMGGIQ